MNAIKSFGSLTEPVHDARQMDGAGLDGHGYDPVQVLIAVIDCDTNRFCFYLDCI